MIYKNLKTFVQHLLRNKLYSSITIFGFSISLMFILLLSIYIKNEYSADQFHVNKERIFRLTHGDESDFAPPSGPLLMQKFPEVENFTRTRYLEMYACAPETQKLKSQILFADSSFLNIFTYKMLEGDKKTALNRENTVVLTKSFAYKLFGKLPELGLTFTINDDINFVITGIMEDVPDNSHFNKFDLLANFPSLGKAFGMSDFLDSYNSNSYGLYVLTKGNTNFQSKTPEILKLFKEVNWMFKKEYAKSVELEPIVDSYFSTSHSSNSKNKSKRFVQILSGIVFLILVLSIINYVNLTVAQSSFRNKEIAVKKLIGAKKAGLLLQSLSESILLSFISLIIALVLSFQMVSVFNYLLDTRINLLDEFTMRNLFFAFVFMLLIGIISGIIPALKITKFNPIEVVKGESKMKEKNIYSKIMICFQYLIIIILITSAFFISKQTNFLRNYKLGFEQENMLCFEYEVSNKKQRVLEEILEKIPGVEDVSLSCGTPLDGGNNNCFTYKDKELSFQHFFVDTNFFKLLNIPVKKTGVAFSQDVCWLNEAAVKKLELPENPTTFKLYNKEYPVYGVVKDFHFKNLKSQLGPAYFHILKPDRDAWTYVIKLKSGNNYETIQKIKKAHSDFTNGIPLRIDFFDEVVRDWYAKEEKTGKIVKYFAILTVIISVMGLFAMSLYYVQQKQKEIGIRKVNGAKTSEILKLINRDFSLWVIIAFVLACPISWYAMNKWLQNFAYKTELSWWIFALAGLIAMGIAMLTVSFQSWRAATRNPVESLRYE
ncbi:putative ABC transport system permease protein [Ancylomarina subtilis]|uniref:Putative ABC transport system permease protein n=1 Tax=Ancylomarina subtilis TaxID=1639035 RepID=A0A4Q7VMJ8_9BACT|nr:ABC transporter permease [Ancylomarina subtilis]RZT97543.1 putative ABC transport system permease protein [Ancylomarina subtilis]